MDAMDDLLRKAGVSREDFDEVFPSGAKLSLIMRVMFAKSAEDREAAIAQLPSEFGELPPEVREWLGMEDN